VSHPMQVAPLVHDHQPSQLWNKNLDLITTNSMIFHISLILSLFGHVTFHCSNRSIAWMWHSPCEMCVPKLGTQIPMWEHDIPLWGDVPNPHPHLSSPCVPCHCHIGTMSSLHWQPCHNHVITSLATMSSPYNKCDQKVHTWTPAPQSPRTK